MILLILSGMILCLTGWHSESWTPIMVVGTVTFVIWWAALRKKKQGILVLLLSCIAFCWFLAIVWQSGGALFIAGIFTFFLWRAHRVEHFKKHPPKKKEEQGGWVFSWTDIDFDD